MHITPYYTPIQLPKIEPDNWDIFWKIWNEEADFVHKTTHPHEKSRLTLNDKTCWRGMEIYDPTATKSNRSIELVSIDIRDRLPKMYESIQTLKTFFKSLSLIFIESQYSIGSHTDKNIDKWMLRSFFYYPSPEPQWYFTRPDDNKGERTYITLPQDTTWFAFNDSKAWHGTDYDEKYPKILIKAYGSLRDDVLKDNLKRYEDYVLSFDSNS